MASKVHIKKGDNVLVIAGDSKGKTGKVLEVIVSDNRAVVEGVNLATKHSKPNAKNPKGGIIKQEMSIHVSNLKLADKKSAKSDATGEKKAAKTTKTTTAKKTVKTAKKTGEETK